MGCLSLKQKLWYTWADVIESTHVHIVFAFLSWLAGHLLLGTFIGRLGSSVFQIGFHTICMCLQKSPINISGHGGAMSWSIYSSMATLLTQLRMWHVCVASLQMDKQGFLPIRWQRYGLILVSAVKLATNVGSMQSTIRNAHSAINMIFAHLRQIIYIYIHIYIYISVAILAQVRRHFDSSQS